MVSSSYGYIIYNCELKAKVLEGEYTCQILISLFELIRFFLLVLEDLSKELKILGLRLL